MPEAGRRDRLDAVVDRTSAALDLAGPDGRTPWLFARCWLLATRFEDHGRNPDDLERALTDFRSLPPGASGREKLAAVLVVAQLRAGMFRDRERLRRVGELVAIAGEDPHPLPDWPKAAAAVRSLELLDAAQYSLPGASPRAALAELERLAEVVADTQPHASMVEMARLGIGNLRAAVENDQAAAGELVGRAGRLQAQLGNGSPGHDKAGMMTRLLSIQAAAARGDVVAARRGLQELLDAADQLPLGDHLRRDLEQMRASVEPLLRLLPDTDVADPAWSPAPGVFNAGTVAQLNYLREQAEAAGLSGAERAARLSQLASLEMGLGPDSPALLDGAVEHFRGAVAAAPEQDPRRVSYLLSQGTAHLRRLELVGRQTDLATGTRLLEQARAAAGSPAHGLWAMCSIPLAHAYRLTGRKELARRVALSGLRGHAWSVLLQSSTADTHAAARHAAGDALDVARWCLEDGDPTSAAAALDAGRGLILYAATRTRNVEAELVARGEQRLAQRWRQAVATGGIAGTAVELRREVLARLVGEQAGVADPDFPCGPGPASMGADADPPGAARVLDPPSAHEVRAALVALGMDALVYLVPGDGKPGAAVVIHASEPPSWLLLPELRRSENPELDRFLAPTIRGAAGGRRDIESPTAEDVDQVCDWAWRVAIGPLLRQHLPEPAGGRPARIVLVPIRELARVPWHAARRRTPHGYEYAVQDTVFSYAASARLLCEVAWRAGPPLSGAGLIVGDPDPGAAACHLPAARAEALAIRSAFYQDARYLGRLADGSVSPDGAGRRAEVAGWLARVTGGEVLHLACHGVVHGGTGPGNTSYLLLAGEERLAAEELVDALRTAPGRGVELAVLAACSSGTSGRGYDEAFSLATALLASDARSVVSAQWSVPDEETSVLMFLFHHYLRHEGHRPADALRAAQLWLLEGPREPPATMPAWLRERVPSQDRVAVSGWAGFIHSGW